MTVRIRASTSRSSSRATRSTERVAGRSSRTGRRRSGRGRPSRRGPGRSSPRRPRTGARAVRPPARRGRRGARRGERRRCGAVVASGLGGPPWSVSMRMTRPGPGARPIGPPRRPAGSARARRPHAPRSPPEWSSGHCDRYGVTLATCRKAVADPFSQPVVSSPPHPVRPDTGTPHRHQGSRGPGYSRRPSRPVRRAAALRAHQPPIHALPEAPVTYVDRTLTCVDCGSEFIHSADDQEYYSRRASPPTRSAA